MHISSRGNVGWNLIFSCIAKNTYIKKLENGDKSIHILPRTDGTFSIWSVKELKNADVSRIVTRKSSHEVEPRPYVYYVDRKELLRTLPDIDNKTLNKLDSDRYSKEDVECFENKGGTSILLS